MPRFTHLAIDKPDRLLFGQCPLPVTTPGGLTIGDGRVLPEVNFTLPPMLVRQNTFDRVLGEYEQMITGVLQRAEALGVPGLVVEFETVPDLTAHPQWGLDVTRLLLEALSDARQNKGLACALRLTPNDNREMVRPPIMRSGPHWEAMLELFRTGAEAGADLLSIESVGGKEIHDDALMCGDLRQALLALCVLGARDMRFVWSHIGSIAERSGAVAAGDTACGFANTAMVLADKGMIPKVFAAVDRAMSAVRSLVAYECGATGPGKDCGYENPILKCITGRPMSMEGKSAACAHLSPLGNLPMAYGDLWSNESVQNVKLLGGMAPTVSTEMLAYDARLLNCAIAAGPGSALELRNWLIDSDADLDPQAYIFRPEHVLRLAGAIVEAPDDYHAGICAAREALDILREGHRSDRLKLDAREEPYLERMLATLDALPDSVERFLAEMMDEVDNRKWIPEDYEPVLC